MSITEQMARLRIAIRDLQLQLETLDRLKAAVEQHRARTTVCAWCPGFDRRTQPPGTSHGLCPNCAARIAQLEAQGTHESH